MIYNDDFVFCNIDIIQNYSKLDIYGNVKNPGLYNKMLLIAANPMDRMTNYSGSGLPFPCMNIAFENTPNKLLIDDTGSFSVTFSYPNSYYLSNGKDKIISSIFFSLEDKNGEIKNLRYELVDICTLRTLVNRSSRKGPEFYSEKDYILPIANSEIVMREYARAKTINNIG
jgi:hypothetical protein